MWIISGGDLFVSIYSPDGKMDDGLWDIQMWTH